MSGRIKTGGGWPAVRYALRTARRAGGLFKFYRALQSRNACKTCALGMGGQRGGMVDESGRFPEICKKSMQAMAADMQGRIEPEFFEKYGFAEMRRMSPRDLEHMGRLCDPIYAGPDDSHFRVIGWDEALQRCIARLKQTKPDENFFYLSGRSSNEAAFLLQLFARLYGTNNVNNCSYYCHQASGVGLSSVFGTGTATIVLDDLKHCDCVFLIGGNPASNHPRMMRILMEVRRRGGQVVVINPLIETGLVRFSVPSDIRSLLFSSEIASRYVQVHIGGDIALLTGIAKRIDELGAVDESFVARHTEGGEAFRRHVRSTSWAEIERGSGVGRDEIDDVARTYAASQSCVFAWTMGITHHTHGADNVRAIANLALMRGMVGRPHAGLLPIRGHSNVQGVGSVGVTPKLKDAIFERLESHFDVKLPTTPGMDTLSCMQAMSRGEIRNAWCLGGNLFGSNPDTLASVEAFSKLESVTYLSTALNTGHAWGRGRHTLVLPMQVRDEESQVTTQESMFSYVRVSDGGPPRHYGPRSEVEVVAHLAAEVLGGDGPIDWRAMKSHRNIRAVIAAVIPGYEAIDEVDESRREFQIGGRTFHEPKFKTPTGRARFHITAIPANDRTGDELRLMTVRSEGQFNTVVYEEHDLYRNQDRRDIILINEADMARLGLHADQRVTIRSETGEMKGISIRPYAVKPGNVAMYFPEANALVPRAADPETHTPAFKSVLVTIRLDERRTRIAIAEQAVESANKSVA